ncbi:hypothetical protein ACA910_018864 [Epithemia clementina (nom. ined.)]
MALVFPFFANLLAWAGLVLLVRPIAAVRFDTQSMGRNNLKGEYLKFVSRTYVPYGPDLASNPKQAANEQPWTGFGYGFGATEHWVYDHLNKYIYSQSEAGEYIAIMDYLDETLATVTSYSLDLTSYNSDIRDIAICPSKGLLFVSLFELNKVLMFQAVDRNSPDIPKVIKEIDAGNAPDALRLTDDCKYLAVANQNEARSITDGAGSVHIVSNFQEDDQTAVPDVQKVSFSSFTDTDLIRKKLHMPLTKNSMMYMRDVAGIISDDALIDWNYLIDNYDPAIALDPEFMAFNNDGTRLFVNLQDNSGLVSIDPATGQVLQIQGYGLKPATSGVGVDLLETGGCSRLTTTGAFLTNPCLFLGRTPDAITTVEVDGVDYVITAEEGSDFGLGEYGEKYDAKDLFNGTSFTLPGFVADPSFFDTSDATKGCAANFNSECDEALVERGWCASGFELTIGSMAVDYETNYTEPIMSRIVGFGGRGLGIFKVDRDTNALQAIWDSGSDFEVETCKSFPWAHNAIQDDNFIAKEDPAYTVFADNQEDYDERNDPAQDGCQDRGDGEPGPCPMKDTVGEQSASDGPAVESVVVGVACGRLVMVGCGENNGICALYDISNITSPVLKKVFHLSPVSENFSPTVAYKNRTLGDIDSETILFLNDTISPTGKTAIMFGGAISGTISLYEFQCESDDGAGESDDDLEAGAIAGIVIGSVFGGVLIAVLCVVMSGRRGGSRNQKEMDTADVPPSTEMTSQPNSMSGGGGGSAIGSSSA